MLLAGGDPHAHSGERPVHAHRVEQIAADEGLLDLRGERGQVDAGDQLRRSRREAAHVDEREDLLVLHAIGRFVDGALEHLAVQDDDLAAEVVAASDAEVTEAAHVGDRDARLVGAGEQRVEHGELGHRGIRLKDRHSCEAIPAGSTLGPPTRTGVGVA